MINLASLRAKSEQEAARFPALLARADHIAGTILMGSHGRRRAGVGDDFWQYRPFQTGDSPRGIDWRRSARGDTHYVREHEWQIAQSVTLWVDQSASMDFKSDGIPESKADRARLISLALTILLTHGGERIGLAHPAIAPQRGRPQIERIAQALMTSVQTDFCAPNAEAMPPFGRAVFVSDFLCFSKNLANGYQYGSSLQCSFSWVLESIINNWILHQIFIFSNKVKIAAG